MSKRMMGWIIAGATLVLLGGIIFVGAMSAMNWDFAKLSTSSYETNTHQIKEDYNDILIDIDTADITFAASNNGKTTVVCHEDSKAKHSVSVNSEGNLVIKIKNEKKWYDYLGFNFESPKITLSLPSGKYGALSIKASTGDVNISKDFSFESISVVSSTGDVECGASTMGKLSISLTTGDILVKDLSAGEMDLSVTTGRIELSSVDCAGKLQTSVSTGKSQFKDILCKSLFSNGSTGDIFLENVIASEKLSVERSTGDIELEHCDAGELFLSTSTGDVEGSLLSDKVFIYDTDTGDVDLPKTTTGGKCEIETDTGDIEIKIDHKK